MALLDTFLMLLVAAGIFYILFMRISNNALIAIFKRKSYVVCHVRKSATRKPVIYFVIPDVVNNYLTRVGGHKTYELNPDNSAYKENGRYHFILNEEDAMPLKFKEVEIRDDSILYTKRDFLGRISHIYFKADEKGKALKLDPRTDDDYIIGADRVDQGMYSKSHRILHGQENQWALYIALLALLIAIGAAIYGYYTISKIQPLVDVIYSKITPDSIQIK